MDKRKRLFMDYGSKALAHEFASMVYSALQRREVTAEWLAAELGWSTNKMIRILDAFANTTLEDAADIMHGLGYALHFTYGTFKAEPLDPSPPTPEAEGD